MMNPTVTNIVENNQILEFTLQMDVSIANAIRKILSEIEVNAFITETFEEINAQLKKILVAFITIIKQRLSCIPIHMEDLNIYQINAFWS